MNKGGSTAANGGFTNPALQRWHCPESARHSLTRFARTPGHSQAGFTIVETLIVLVVTGSMLLMAMIFISGRQAQTQFQTGINEIQQQIQQVVNEANSGYYPNEKDFNCKNVGGYVQLNGTPSEQGTNVGCIFLGKALLFGTDTDASQLGIIPIVGNQFSTGSTLVSQITQAKPRALYPFASETPAGEKSLAFDTMKYELKVAGSTPACPSGGMCYSPVSGGQAETGAIVILAADKNGNIASASSGSKPGFQQYSLYAVQNVSPGDSVQTVAEKIGNGPAPYDAQGIEPASKATICIENGNNKSGLFTIDNSLHVTLQIFGGSTCS